MKHIYNKRVLDTFNKAITSVNKTIRKINNNEITISGIILGDPYEYTHRDVLSAKYVIIAVDNRNYSHAVSKVELQIHFNNTRDGRGYTIYNIIDDNRYKTIRHGMDFTSFKIAIYKIVHILSRRSQKHFAIHDLATLLSRYSYIPYKKIIPKMYFKYCFRYCDFLNDPHLTTEYYKLRDDPEYALNAVVLFFITKFNNVSKYLIEYRTKDNIHFKYRVSREGFPHSYVYTTTFEKGLKKALTIISQVYKKEVYNNDIFKKDYKELLE